MQSHAGEKISRNERQGLATDDVDQPEEVGCEYQAESVVDRGVTALEEVIVVHIDQAEEGERDDKSADEKAIQLEIAH
jgi:hypothetical protein